MTWSEARKQLTRMKRDLSKKIKEMRKNIFMSFTMFSWARDTWQALHQWHLFNMVFGDHWWIWSKNKPIFRKKKRLCCLQRGKWLVIKDWIVIWIVLLFPMEYHSCQINKQPLDEFWESYLRLLHYMITSNSHCKAAWKILLEFLQLRNLNEFSFFLWS